MHFMNQMERRLRWTTNFSILRIGNREIWICRHFNDYPAIVVTGHEDEIILGRRGSMHETLQVLIRWHGPEYVWEAFTELAIEAAQEYL